MTTNHLSRYIFRNTGATTRNISVQAGGGLDFLSAFRFPLSAFLSLFMELLPKRTTLVEETVATLKSWITAGILGETLPGELQLKDRLGVGRDTVRLALNLLTQQGWLIPTGQGRQRQVQREHLPLHGGGAAQSLPVTFLSPYPVVHRLTLMEMEDTRARLEEQGRALHFISPRIFHLKNPARHLELLVGQRPSAAWVLNATSAAVQRWFDQRGLPTLLFETPFSGVSLPFVADDWEEAAFHAGLQLIRQGHRIIGILEYEERRPGLLAEERGLERALADAKVAGRLMVFKDDLTPPSVAPLARTGFQPGRTPHRACVDPRGAGADLFFVAGLARNPHAGRRFHGLPRGRQLVPRVPSHPRALPGRRPRDRPLHFGTGAGVDQPWPAHQEIHPPAPGFRPGRHHRPRSNERRIRAALGQAPFPAELVLFPNKYISLCLRPER